MDVVLACVLVCCWSVRTAKDVPSLTAWLCFGLSTVCFCWPQDVRELARDPSPNYFAAPLKVAPGDRSDSNTIYTMASTDLRCPVCVHHQDNLFEWHFTIRGPPDTAFEGGVYHGRILLPSQYPFKPPNIMFLTVRARHIMPQWYWKH